MSDEDVCLFRFLFEDSAQHSWFQFMREIVANGHNVKQFHCGWTTNGLPCNAIVLGMEVPNHLRTVHGVNAAQRIECLWDQCGEDLNRACLIRHVQEKHLEFRWPCPKCGRIWTREGLMHAHRANCEG